MTPQTEIQLVNYLEQLGCSRLQSKAYICLVFEGPQSVLSISKHLKTGRTKLYPALDVLVQKQLIVAHSRHYGTTYEALPGSSLEFLVAEAERKAKELRNALPAAWQLLDKSSHARHSATKVYEHRGIEGLKQVNWNLTKAVDNFLVFEQKSLEQHQHMNKQFVERLRQIWADKQITSYDLTNDPQHRLESSCKKYKKHYAKAAYVPEEIFKIQFESYIYNDCVTLIKYDKNDIVAVEIHNMAFAQQQKQLFWLVWKMAKSLN